MLSDLPDQSLQHKGFLLSNKLMHNFLTAIGISVFVLYL